MPVTFAKGSRLPLSVPILAVLAALLLLPGCSSRPVIESDPPTPGAFHEHALTRQDEHMLARVALLSSAEAQAEFGLDLGSRGIQAIWIEVENRDDVPYWVLMPSLDPNYFAPDEVAYIFRQGLEDQELHQLMRELRGIAFRNPIAPRSAVSGFVFVTMDLDQKQIDLQLLSSKRAEEFVFFLPVRGLNATTLFEVEQVRADNPAVVVDQGGLREALTRLPCCTTDEAASAPGDPLNLVLIGNAEDLFPAFVRRGWHATEATYGGSVGKTVMSYLFGQRYIYSPVSPLYAFGRQQDIAFQKPRGSIHQRNHLRLWLTPFRFEDKEVWVGQISRDIGVKFTSKSKFLVTHVIDPDVDEARNSFVQDLLFSQGLVKVGYVKGGPWATAYDPARNLGDDPYFSDGLRAVMLLDKSNRPIREVQFFEWEHAPPHSNTRQLDLAAPVRQNP
jgi:uncharacterized protein YceK